MKKFLSLLVFAALNVPVLLFCIFCLSSYAQDTIRYGEVHGYLAPDDTFLVAMKVARDNTCNIDGNAILTDCNLRISGISCVMDSCRGRGATVALLQYIGPDSTLLKNMINSDSAYMMYIPVPPPQAPYYRIIDSVRLYPRISPTRYIMLPRSPDSVACGVFDAFFDSTHVLHAGNIYFVVWYRYPDFRYVYDSPNPNSELLIGQIADHEALLYMLLGTGHNHTTIRHQGQLAYNNFWERLDTMASYNFFGTPRPMNLFSANYYYCIFPIVDSLYDLEIVKPCPPLPLPSVAVDRRFATFSWTGDSVHCAYELAYGNAGQDFSTFTSVVTTDTAYTIDCLLPEEKYACRLRALCCLGGDSIWSPWGDTVQYERITYTVKGVSNNIHLGYVLGTRSVDINDTVVLIAMPRYDNVRFTHWGTGDTLNPLTVTALCDTVLMAYFEVVEDTTQTDTTQTDTTTHTEFVLVAESPSEVILTPNPASNYVTVRSSERITDVILFDMTGNKKMSRYVDNTCARLPLGTLPSGIYIVRVNLAHGSFNKKLVVKR